MNLLYRDSLLLLHLHMKLLAKNFHFNLKNTHIPCKHTPELKESCLNKEKKGLSEIESFRKLREKAFQKALIVLDKKLLTQENLLNI